MTYNESLIIVTRTTDTISFLVLYTGKIPHKRKGFFQLSKVQEIPSEVQVFTDFASTAPATLCP
jgi:hypothetical protein